MRIVGTNFMGHDSALCLLDTREREIFAISTERVTRIKHDNKDIEPILARYRMEDIDFVCHGYGGFDVKVHNDVDIARVAKAIRKKAYASLIEPRYIGDFSQPFHKQAATVVKRFFRRPIETLTLLEKLTPAFRKRFLQRHEKADRREFLASYIRSIFEIYGIVPKEILFYDHHLSHAAGAYFCSPFAFEKRCLSVTLDGWGDGSFGKAFLFENAEWTMVAHSPIKRVPHEGLDIDTTHDITSLGVIYGNFTVALGLRRYSDEGKVEALAAFGTKDETLYRALFSATEVSAGGMDYDVHAIKPFYDREFLRKERKRLGDENFAATIQEYLQDVTVRYIEALARKYPETQALCLSGGVAANIIMNLDIYERTRFKNIYIFPPMGDEGVAIGSALLKALEEDEDISWVNQNYMPYFGNRLERSEVEAAIEKFSSEVEAEHIGEEWYLNAAESIAKKKIVAVVQGRMEFGPRALGNRSILANPIDPKTKDRINLTVKRRPKYQPFCPSILEEERERLFEESFSHKHMAIGFRVKKEFHDKIPSAIHVDGTARPQFVEEKDNPSYYKLLKRVKELTGYGVVINTSFNLHGRTIVHTAEDALQDFIDCNIDELYIEGYKITRR